MQAGGLLPQGVETVGMLFRTGWVDGRPVSSLWIGGYGRAIMLAAERELSGLGVPRLGLNVFGSNTVAIGL